MQNLPDLKLNLKQLLQRGTDVVKLYWSYKTKDWITGISIADVDNDGDQEIIVGSRDGRVHMFSDQGECRWVRIVGSKRWIGAVIARPLTESQGRQAAVLVGTQDGKIYALDKDGKTLSRGGQEAYPFDKNGWAVDRERDRQAFWYDNDYVIRHLAADLNISPLVAIDLEDGACVYTLHMATGDPGWTFQLPAPGGVRAIYAGDIDNDGRLETLVGSSDQHLYILDDTGRPIEQFDIPGQIHLVYARDIDQNGKQEILLGLDGKQLVRFDYTAPPGEQGTQPAITRLHRFVNEFQAIFVADIDQDGRSEILIGSADKYLYILDGSGKELWRYYVGQRIANLSACDVDNDGTVEVLVGSEDNRLSVFHIELQPDLIDEIRTCYQELGHPSIASMGELSPVEKSQLQQLVQDTRPGSKPISLEQIEKWLAAGHYTRALTAALELEQQHLQSYWQKGHSEPIGRLCFGDLYSDPRREIVAGTDKGSVHIFNSAGADLGSFRPGGQIVSVQVAYLTPGKHAQILVGSTDGTIRVVSPTRQQNSTRHPLFSGRTLQTLTLGETLSAMCVNTDEKSRALDIVAGTKEKNVYVYGRELTRPRLSFTIPQPANVLCARLPQEDHELAIVAGGIENGVYAYAHNGTFLWEHHIWGRAEAVCIEDIDGDGAVEVLVGSQDRNLHVIDVNGNLKWRYYLPSVVLALDVVDLDHDSRLEILVGCKDDYLYVFGREGDLLWRYQAQGRVAALCARDIDDDKKVELSLGLADRLEVMHPVDQRYLRSLINQCWQEMQLRHSNVNIRGLLHDQSPYLRAFALRKLAEQEPIDEEDFKNCAPLLKDGSIEVRKALVQTILRHYHSYPEHAQTMLMQVSKDQENEVMLVLVKELATFIRRDKARNWEIGFKHLQRIVNRYAPRETRDTDRYVLREIMRTLYNLIEDFYQQPQRKRTIFGMLLQGLLYEKSAWVRQEAARTLAHFLDLYYTDLLIYISILICKKVKTDTLQRVVYHAKAFYVQHVFQSLWMLIDGLNEENVFARMEMAINALSEIRYLRYGEETWQIYKELNQLLHMRTVSDIAAYDCPLCEDPHSANEHFRCVLNVFERLFYITRPLQRYLARTGIKDRMNSLLEASRAIDRAISFTDQEYATPLFEEPMKSLPDYQVFCIIYKRWKEIVEAELQRLSGKPEIVTELETKIAPHEERIAVWLKLSNKGQNTAYRLHAELLTSDRFKVMGKGTFETEMLFAQDDIRGEFTISPLTTDADLPLTFEVEYQEMEDGGEKTLRFEHLLHLQKREQREFEYIPNPYSSGLPMRNMCYGREEDLKVLSQSLTRSRAKALLILFGQRRTGKTTVLLQLAYTSILAPHIPCFIDMQSMAYGVSDGQFFSSAAYAISQALKAKGITVQPPQEEIFAKNPRFAFDQFLDEVEAGLQERKLIILMDEFDVLDSLVKSGKLAPEIFGYLRSLIQHREKLAFLMAGVHTIEQLAREYWSVFFQIARHRRLGKLSSRAAVELITLPVKDYLEYEEFAIRKIRELTADQPYLIHMVCGQLVEYCNDHCKRLVTVHDINVVFDTIMHSNQQHFEWLWDQSSYEERHLLAILAEEGGMEGRLLSLIEIEEQYKHYHIVYERKHILAALKNLEEKDIVERVPGSPREGTEGEDRYRIPVGLIRGWLRLTRPVMQVLREQSPGASSTI